MKRSSQEKGMALVFALVAVLIISALLGGVMMLSVSSFTLSNTNSDYAVALDVAEAGINYELNHINDNVGNPNHLGDQADSPYTLDLPAPTATGYTQPIDLERSYSVYVVDDATGNTWTAPNDLRVFSTGIVKRVADDGRVISEVKRTVVVKVKGNDISGPSGIYALFGISTLNCNGNLTVNGASGTDGTLIMKGGSVDLNGNFYYCGVSGGPLVPGDPRIDGYDVYYNSMKEVFPTVNELANRRAQTAYPTQYAETTTRGVNFFSEVNSNSSIVDTQGNVVSVTKNPDKPPSQSNPSLLDDDAFRRACIDTQRYLTDGVTENPLYNKNVLVLNPGDYYFQGMNVNAQYGLKINNADGVVNIWLGAEGATGTGNNKTDQLNGGSQLTANSSSSMFNVYEGSRREFNLNGKTQVGSDIGTDTFYGNVYAYNGTTDDPYGTVKLNGSATIFGSVIANTVERASGNGTITFPNVGSGDMPPGLPGDFFGYVEHWAEPRPQP